MPNPLNATWTGWLSYATVSSCLSSLLYRSMGFGYGLVTGEPEFLLTGRIDAYSISSAWPDLLRAPAGANRDFHFIPQGVEQR